MKKYSQYTTGPEPEGKFTPDGELYLPPEDDMPPSLVGDFDTVSTTGTPGRIVPPGANTDIDERFSEMPEDAFPSALLISSPDFDPLHELPTSFTCNGGGRRPDLTIRNVPVGTESLALVMHDPDAVHGDFTHWIMWDIPSGTATIPGGSLPQGAKEGLNSSGARGWTAPCPPKGTGKHRYIFELYALSQRPAIPADTDRSILLKAIQDHIIGMATLIGIVTG